MEKMELDLKEYELKKNIMNKTYESLHSQASSLLVFTHQWKELEEQLDSIRDETQTRLKEIQEREKQLEAKESKVQSEANELCGLEQIIEEKRKEVTDTKNYLNCLQSMMKVLGDQERQMQRAIKEQDIRFDLKEKLIRAKEEKLNEIVKAIEGQKQEGQKLREERLKEEEMLKEQKKSVVEVSMPVKSSEEIRKKIELKVKDHCLRKKSMEELSCNLECKEKELELREQKVSSKAEELESLNKNLERKEKELELGEKQLSSKTEELDLLNKRTLNELQLMAKQLEEDAKQLQVKERQLEVKMEKLEQECKTNLEEKERQLEVKRFTMEQMHQEREKHLETKERQLEVKSETMEKLQQECKKHLDEKERQLEEQGKELELAKKQFGFQMKVNSEPLESTLAANNSASDHSKINTRDARGLQLFMYDHLKRNESVTKEISALLKHESLEPAKLILEAMQWFHPSNSTVDNADFDLGLIRRSCILLLQELKRISVQMSPKVREEAMRLASDWKANITVGTESWLEILGFLQLVSTYQLTSVYDANELQGLLEKVDKHEQATELSRAFGTTDKASANNISIASVPTEKAVSPARVPFSFPDHQPTAKKNIIVSPGTNRKRNHQRASIVPPNVVGPIQSLIQKKKLVKAYGRIRKFNLFHKFPPQQVLKEYVEEAMKCMEISKTRKTLYEQDQVVNRGIADLRHAIDCIKAHNLKSQYTSESIEKHIQELKKFMEDRRNENQKKRLCSTVDSGFQQHEHKFQRTSLSAERPSGLHPDYPNPCSFYTGQFSIPSNIYPVQFSMPANPPLGFGNPGSVLQNPQ